MGISRAAHTEFFMNDLKSVRSCNCCCWNCCSYSYSVTVNWWDLLVSHHVAPSCPSWSAYLFQDSLTTRTVVRTPKVRLDGFIYFFLIPGVLTVFLTAVQEDDDGHMQLSFMLMVS